MKSIFPFGIRKDMSVIEWNRETCDFRIRKGRYILQKTQILQKSYRSEEVAFYMVKIFKDDNTKLVENLSSHEFSVTAWIKALARYPSLEDEKSELKTIEQTVELISTNIRYGKNGAIKEYWNKPCVLAYALNSIGGVIFFKTARSYKAMMIGKNYYGFNIDVILMKEAYEEYKKIVENKIRNKPLSEKHQSDILSMKV